MDFWISAQVAQVTCSLTHKPARFHAVEGASGNVSERFFTSRSTGLCVKSAWPF